MDRKAREGTSQRENAQKGKRGPPQAGTAPLLQMNGEPPKGEGPHSGGQKCIVGEGTYGCLYTRGKVMSHNQPKLHVATAEGVQGTDERLTGFRGLRADREHHTAEPRFPSMF